MIIPRLTDRPEPLRVVIVGGGAAAIIAAVHLFADADALPHGGLHVHLVERDAGFGPGLPYRTEHPRHTVNNFAERLSAVHGDPGHLIRWCAGRGLDLGARSFPSRRLYGEYLASVLASIEVPADSALLRTQGEVVDLEPAESRGWRVRLAGGETIEADRVVLALGTPPPHPMPHLERLGRHYLADPWSAELPDRLDGVRRVLFLGTGLTMVDVAAQVHELAPRAELVAASRHGELPRAHLVEPTDGTDWRDAVDAVRAFANQLWQGLSPDDQGRFATAYARRWDTHRHRMSPAMASHIAGLQSRGSLVVRTIDQVAPADFDLVVNCTGFRPVPSRGWNPLVDALLARGLLRANRLGLGVDLVQPGHPVGSDGEVIDTLFWLGAARKGLEWEVSAIPDLREQAVALTQSVRRQPRLSAR